MAIDLSDRFDATAAWAALSEELRTAIGATVLSGLVADELVSHGEATEDQLYVRVGLATERLVGDDLDRLLTEVSPLIAARVDLPSGAPRIPALLGPVCRQCGCSEMDACAGGCAWAAENLCTACAATGGGAP